MRWACQPYTAELHDVAGRACGYHLLELPALGPALMPALMLAAVSDREARPAPPPQNHEYGVSQKRLSQNGYGGAGPYESDNNKDTVC